MLPERKFLNILEQAQTNLYFLLKQICKDKIILEVSCNEGGGSASLASSGAKKVVGIDLFVEKINTAKNNFKQDNLDFIVANGEQVDQLFDDIKFDIILINLPFNHFVDMKKFFLGIKKIQSENAIIIIAYSKFKLPFAEETSQIDNSFSKTLQEATDILGPPSQVLQSYPAYGVVSCNMSQNIKETVSCNVNIQSLADTESCLTHTIVYDPGQITNLNASIDIVDTSTWGDIVSYDYIAALKKEREIFELKQRSLLAQALVIENEMLSKNKKVKKYAVPILNKINSFISKIKKSYVT